MKGRIGLEYDVIVVGAGHAGCEAALAAARLGASTLLITMSPDTIAAMSCNPAIGGPAAKSHLVRELDALGGEMGRVIDHSYLNIRRINETRGPAVAALRAQADKRLYQSEMILRIERQPHLTLKQGLVTDLIIEKKHVTGVTLKSGRIYNAKSIILATGTFLGGTIVMGEVRYPGGRQGEPAAVELSHSLTEHGIRLRRFQTATPPRISQPSVDFGQLTQQPLFDVKWGFSWDGLSKPRVQTPCWYTTTTPETIRIIQQNLHLSPIRSGSISGKGPRFCPSIDRKVLKFPDKTNHLIFLEPEGSYSEELYMLGLTTAMPETVQEQVITTVPGLQHAEIVRPGYAVEYDCLDSFQFKPSLESKEISNLFTAGQINGTSGYEEAAVQGLIAGVNAVRKLRSQSPFIPDRTQSYIGVLLDDLATQGTEEPYRMMTSLAEFRLFLRLDNALTRLGHFGKELGLINDQEWLKRKAILDDINKLQILIHETKINATASFWTNLEMPNPDRGYRLQEIILRPEITMNMIIEQIPEISSFSEPVREYVWNELKLEGYLSRQRVQLEENKRFESILFSSTNFQLNGLSVDAQIALAKVQPLTLGQAFRIHDLNSTDRSLLLIHSYPEKGVS